MPSKLTSKSKKKAMEESMEWLRNNEPDLDEVDDEVLEVFTNMTGFSTPKKFTPKSNKQKAKDAVEWIRNNEINIDDFPEESLIVMESLAPSSKISISSKEKMDKDDALDNTIEWLRNNESQVDDIDEETIKVLTSMTGVRMPQ